MANIDVLSDMDLGEFGRKLFLKILEQTATEGEFDDLHERCRTLNKKYVDENFLSGKTSLIQNWADTCAKDKAPKWKHFIWRRPHEFLDSNKMKVFDGDIEPGDIKQGCLGDCYFLSSISVLSEHPQRIRKLFITHEVNEHGIYGVRICKNGEWKEVIVDDQFPCSDNSSGPCFSDAHGDELWVLILEKAWAKLHGSYLKIEAGLAEHALRDLTGAPCQVLSHDDEDLWANLLEAESNKFVMAGSAGSTDASKELLEEMGLIGQHSYGILDVREVDTREGTEQLIKLRNPWGDYEWKGDWSDSSANWTPELKAELNFVDANDGTFWMSFADFCHYFSRVQICRVNDSYVYSSINAEHEKKERTIMRMVIKEEGLQYITVSQTDKRCTNKASYDYSSVRLIIAKQKEDGGLDYILGRMKTDRDVWEVHHFEVGDYLCYVEIDWVTEDHNNFIISAYGEKDVHFIRDEKNEHPKFLEQVFISKAKKQGKKIDFSADGAPNCFKYTDMCQEGYGYNYFENFSEDCSIKETVTYTRFEGLELVKPFKGSSYEVLVPPGQNLIVLLRQTGPYGYNLSFSYSSSIQFTTDALKKRVKEKGIKVARKDPRLSVDIDIFVYSIKHGAGICYLYENNTTNRTLEELVEFKTSGLQIVGYKGNKIKVKIGPGESQFIELKALSANWSIQTSVSYGIL